MLLTYMVSREIPSSCDCICKLDRALSLNLKNVPKPGLNMPLRFIKQNENSTRKDSLARKLNNHSVNDFWKEVKLINNSKTPLSTDIDGVEGAEKNCTSMEKPLP